MLGVTNDRRSLKKQFSLQWFTPLVTCSIHPVFCYPRPLSSILLEVKRPTARSRLLPARYRRASRLQGGLSWLMLMFLYNIGAITTGLRKSAWQQTKMSGLQQGLSPRRVIIGETELKHQISCQVFPTFPPPSRPHAAWSETHCLSLGFLPEIPTWLLLFGGWMLESKWICVCTGSTRRTQQVPSWEKTSGFSTITISLSYAPHAFSFFPPS